MPVHLYLFSVIYFCRCLAVHSRGKEPVIELTSSPVSKRTRHSSKVSNSEKFKTPLDSQTFSSTFQDASTVVEWIVQFNTMGSTFIPRIFVDKDQGDLFGNFEDPIDELVKEFYSNARFIGVKLRCQVRGKEFIITPDYLAKILRITQPKNVDSSPYDDKLPQVSDILQILKAEHEVSAKGTSIGIAKFKPELKTLMFIMFSNLYPLSNTGFINLGRAQFLCDLITGAPIDICAHIFQTIGKAAARMCLPLCSLLMKIMKHEGVLPPKDGKIIVRHHPISIASLQKSKSHSSAKRKKQDLSITPKSESAYTTPGHTETTSPHISQPQTASIQPGQSSTHADRFTILAESLHECVSRLANAIYSTNNQVQMPLTAIETQLEEIQCKLEETLQLFVPKRGRAISVYKLYRLDDSIQ